ncbi:MAG: hypothetical protein Sapg2KO_08720 [Saprospiraceae bacterium]
MIQYVGIIVELLLLGVGVYIYLFSIGVAKIKKPSNAEKAEKFRQENGSWLKILALALMAIMFFNVVLSLGALF